MNPVQTCKRKKRFDTRKEAKRAIVGCKNYLHTYYCELCGGYHNGHIKWSPDKLTKKGKRV